MIKEVTPLTVSVSLLVSLGLAMPGPQLIPFFNPKGWRGDFVVITLPLSIFKESQTMATNIPDRDLRQRDIVPPEALNQCRATVIGVGAIGRQVALQLAAIGMPWLQLIDPDTVEAVNLAPQGYLEHDLNRPKVEATADLCQQINPMLAAYEIKERFAPPRRCAEAANREEKTGEGIGNVLFCCVDSITTRQHIWEAVKDRVQFFADGRMSAEVLRVLAAADPGSRKHYPTTLFAADEAYTGGCTAKSTIFTANIAAGLMVQQFSRWLRRMPVEPDITLNLLAGEWTVGALEKDQLPGLPGVPVSQWQCEAEGCKATAEMTFAAIADVGTPICPDCGEDMKLKSPL